MEKVQVRLTRKFAEMIDGVDLSRNVVGQTLSLTPAKARLLRAEGWGEPVEKRPQTEPAAPFVSLPVEPS